MQAMTDLNPLCDDLDPESGPFVFGTPTIELNGGKAADAPKEYPRPERIYPELLSDCTSIHQNKYYANDLKGNLTKDQLARCLHYDQDTGTFIWRSHLGKGRRKAGSIAGTITRYGYRYMRLLGYQYAAHRLAWLYTYEEWPRGQLDHINGERDDNRISNLRIVSMGENHRNASLSRRHKNGIIGVSYRKADARWEATIGGCQENYLGRFIDFFEACCARKSAEVRLGYHQNHGARISKYLNTRKKYQNKSQPIERTKV